MQTQGGFLPVPPDFQYQNEQPVAANQSGHLKKLVMQKKLIVSWRIIFILVLKMEEQLK